MYGTSGVHGTSYFCQCIMTRLASTTASPLHRMKAIAYSIKSQEKELLTLANKKRHDLTMISNELNDKTVAYAQGKQVLIVSPYDIVDKNILRELKAVGVLRIITRSAHTTHIDLVEATRLGFEIANAPDVPATPDSIANRVILNLNLWESGNCVGDACCCQKVCVMQPQRIKELKKLYGYGE